MGLRVMVESKEKGKEKDYSHYGVQILLLRIYSQATDILHTRSADAHIITEQCGESKATCPKEPTKSHFEQYLTKFFSL